MSLRRSLIAGALTVAAAAALAPPGVAAAQSTSVKVGPSKLGRILVDSHGKTLYLWAHDKGHMSTCNGQCAVYWPPLVISGKPTAGPGARAGLLGTSRRGDGRMQVTYHGHPLYRFAGDKKAGDVKGEGLTGFGGRWDPVSPAGVAVRKPSASKAAYAGHAWQVTSPGFFATGRVTLIAYAVAGTAPGHVSTPGAGAISNVVRVPFTTGG